MQGIENLIIDLGGVLYAIDIHRSIHAFSLLMGGKSGDLELVVQQMHHNPVWKEFEKGVIDKKGFRDGIRKGLMVNVEDARIDAAWNALLIGPIEGRAQILEQLAAKYRLILLSNTNSIHFEYLSPHSASILDPFEKLFLSFEMGCRKPDKEIYQKVLDWGDFDPKKSLFIDDTLINIKGARSVGLMAEYVEEKDARLFTELTTTLF